MNFMLEQWLDLLATRDPTPASGSLALATLGGCAALVAKSARLSGESPEPFASYAADFALFAAEDSDDYSALATGEADRTGDALKNGLRHTRVTLAFLEAAIKAAKTCKPALLPDLRAACSLAENSASVLFDNLTLNLEQFCQFKGEACPHIGEVSALRERLSALPAI